MEVTTQEKSATDFSDIGAPKRDFACEIEEEIRGVTLCLKSTGIPEALLNKVVDNNYFDLTQPNMTV